MKLSILIISFALRKCISRGKGVRVNVLYIRKNRHADVKKETEVAEIYNETARFNIPLKVIQTAKHRGGTLPQMFGFLSVDNENLIMSALKKSEERETFILRLYNPTDEVINGKIKVNYNMKEVFFCTLNEERQTKIAINQDNLIDLNVDSNKIVTSEIVV